MITVDFNLSRDRYGDIPAMWRFYDAVLEEVRSIPGITEAGMTQAVPFSGAFGCTIQAYEDERVYQRLSAADLTTCAAQEPTTPGYFEAMGIPLLRGRSFTDADNDQPEGGAVVVSEAFAERFWPGEDPIGKGVGPNGNTDQQFYRVVGVVGDVYDASPTEEAAHVIYYPTVRIPQTSGWEPSQMTMAVRTDREDPLTLVPQIREAVRRVDPATPIARPSTMAARLSASMSRVSFMSALLGIAAAMALALAGIGLYGTISYVVARRTGEIGIRMALGAQVRQVQNLVLRNAVRLVAAGLVVGGAGATLLTRLMRGVLYDVRPNDPLAYATGALVLLAVALLVSYVPARRAARVPPSVALRAGD